MRREEAERIASIVMNQKLPAGSRCLNIGSSTRAFREIRQPHIHQLLIKPLMENGIEFIHCDLKPDEGVDLVGDVLTAEFQAAMSANQADLLLCCNLLEHLTDPQAFADACANLVRPGGMMIVSVPLSYPYHKDPIDTQLRPTPEEIAKFFPQWSLVCGEVVVSETYLQELRRSKNWRFRLAQNALLACMPFYRPKHWRSKASRLRWLFRPYKVSVVLMKKPGEQ